MNKGEKLIHNRYGSVTVISSMRERKNYDEKIIQNAGLQLEITNDEGKVLYSKDRNGALPYLFESNNANLTKV